MNYVKKTEIEFPEYSGVRCLMMPYIQGDPTSVPDAYASYREIIGSVFVHKGAMGFLTIDESPVAAGKPHRGKRAKYGRALHTETGRRPDGLYFWGGGNGTWGNFDRDVRILMANNLDDSCALWDVEFEDTSLDGDIGYAADAYPYDTAVLLKAGEVYEMGILTPHESLPVQRNFNRQFLRIMSTDVLHGYEERFTKNPLM